MGSCTSKSDQGNNGISVVVSIEPKKVVRDKDQEAKNVRHLFEKSSPFSLAEEVELIAQEGGIPDQSQQLWDRLKDCALKVDHFERIHRLSIRWEGVPNFREVEHLGVFGCGQPVLTGFRHILDSLHALGYKKIFWFNMRQEPVIYLNELPFSPREASRLNENMDFGHADAQQLDFLTERLVAKLKRDTENTGIQAYYRDTFAEDPSDRKNHLHLMDVRAENSIQSLRRVYVMLQKSGYDVTYARLPVTDEKAPSHQDFDRLVNLLKDWEPHTAVIFNCQMGKGRTTTGMVCACLMRQTILNHRNKTKSLTLARSPPHVSPSRPLRPPNSVSPASSFSLSSTTSLHQTPISYPSSRSDSSLSISSHTSSPPRTNASHHSIPPSLHSIPSSLHSIPPSLHSIPPSLHSTSSTSSLSTSTLSSHSTLSSQSTLSTTSSTSTTTTSTSTPSTMPINAFKPMSSSPFPPCSLTPCTSDRPSSHPVNSVSRSLNSDHGELFKSRASSAGKTTLSRPENRPENRPEPFTWIAMSEAGGAANQIPPTVALQAENGRYGGLGREESGGSLSMELELEVGGGAGSTLHERGHGMGRMEEMEFEEEELGWNESSHPFQVDMPALPPPLKPSPSTLRDAQFAAIDELVARLADGAALQEQVDAAIHTCGAMENLRDVIFHAQDMMYASREPARIEFWTRMHTNFLERYFYLLVFAAYLRDTVSTRFIPSFSQWAIGRPKIINLARHFRPSSK